MESSYYIVDTLFFIFENLFIIFMIFMWLRTPTRSELRDAEMRIDLRLKRIYDQERSLLERIVALEERENK